jgi:hypothetical protein
MLDAASAIDHVQQTQVGGGPEMPTDALSDVLKAVRLTGAAFFDVIASAPWVAEQPTREMVLPKVLPGAGHLISYHIVTEGSCYAAMLGQEAVPARAGEVIVFTKGDPHVMSSAPWHACPAGDPGRARCCHLRGACRSSAASARAGRPR